MVTPALLKLLNENTEKGVRATEIDEVGELILTSLWIVFFFIYFYFFISVIYAVYISEKKKRCKNQIEII